jgi:hypothetical protein
MAYWLSAPVRTVQTSLASLDAALERLGPPSERGVRALAAPIWIADEGRAPEPRTPRYGALPVLPSDAPVAFIELGRRGLPHAEANPASAAASTSRGPFVPAESPVPPAARPSLFPLRERVTVRPPSLVPSTRPGPVGQTHASLALGPVVREPLREARDAVLDEIVASAGASGMRVAVFAVRRDGIVGWTASPGACERERMRSLRWPPHVRTVLQAVLGRPEAASARVPGDAVHAPLLSALSLRPGHAVTLAAVHAEGRPVAIVLADGAGDSRTERLHEIARAAGVSFERILRRRPAG